MKSTVYVSSKMKKLPALFKIIMLLSITLKLSLVRTKGFYRVINNVLDIYIYNNNDIYMYMYYYVVAIKQLNVKVYLALLKNAKFIFNNVHNWSGSLVNKHVDEF